MSESPIVLLRVPSNLRRFAARASGQASGLALAARPAGSAEVSGVNGAPRSRLQRVHCLERTNRSLVAPTTT